VDDEFVPAIKPITMGLLACKVGTGTDPAKWRQLRRAGHRACLKNRQNRFTMPACAEDALTTNRIKDNTAD